MLVRMVAAGNFGEEWIDDATARQLEQIVNDARARRSQVEVAALK